MSELLAVLFAVFVSTFAIKGYVDYQQIGNDNIRAVATAQQQRQIFDAASTYIKQNNAAIVASSSASTPAIITVAMLQASSVGLLPASFSATNPYGQTWQVQVLQPSTNNLQALVLSIGGETILDKQGAKMAGIMGASGGMIPQNDSGIFAGGAANAYGAFGGWKIATTGYTSVSGGHPAALLAFNAGQMVSNALYRNAVPGQPQLNQMATAIDMTNNDINNIGTAHANTIDGTTINSTTLTSTNINSTNINSTNVNSANVNSTNDTTGVLRANTAILPGGQNLQVGNSFFYGDTVNSAIRQPGDVYFQSSNGGPLPSLRSVQDIDATGNIFAAALTMGNSIFTGDSTNTTIQQNGGLYLHNSSNVPSDIGQVGSIYSSGVYVAQLDDWAMVARNGSNVDNAQPQTSAGSLYVNDVYIRSIGKWASQLQSGGSFQSYNSVGTTGTATTDLIMVIVGCYDCSVTANVNGVQRAYEDKRDKYGQGSISMTVPIRKGESWSVTGALTIGVMQIY